MSESSLTAEGLLTSKEEEHLLTETDNIPDESTSYDDFDSNDELESGRRSPQAGPSKKRSYGRQKSYKGPHAGPSWKGNSQTKMQPATDLMIEALAENDPVSPPWMRFPCLKERSRSQKRQ